MKYLMQNITVFEGTNSRGTYAWMRVELFNDTNPFANPARLPQKVFMTPAIINAYKPLCDEDTTANYNGIRVFRINEEKLQKALDENKPFITRYIDRVFPVIVPLPGYYARTYVREYTDAQGVKHMPGETILNAAGKPEMINSLRVYVLKPIDPETGKELIVEDPNQLALQMLARGFTKVNTAETAEIQAPVEQSNEQVAAANELEALKAELAALKGTV